LSAVVLPSGPPTELADEGLRQHDEGDRLARLGVMVGIAGLPLLLPSTAVNLTPADLGLVLAMGAVLLWAGSTRQRLRLPFVAGVGIIAVAGTLSALLGAYPWLGAMAVVQDLYLLGWAAALATFGRSPGSAEFLIRAWCVSAAAWAIGLILLFGRSIITAGLASASAERAGFSFGESNAAGLYFVLSLLVILAARRPRRWRWRAPAIACLLLGTALTGSLGAISGLLAGLATALVLRTRAQRGPDMAVALSLALVLAAGSAWLLAERHQVVEAAHASRYVLIRNSLGRGVHSSSGRELLAKESLALWRRSGLIGWGPASTIHTLRAQQEPYAKEAHNDWLAALVERGVLGFAGLLLLVLEIGLLASAVWNPRRLTPQFAAALPTPALLVGGLVTVLVFSLTHEVLHDRTVWTLLGLLATFGLWGRPRRWSLGGSG
jgi:O-antigen ligase